VVLTSRRIGDRTATASFALPTAGLSDRPPATSGVSGVLVISRGGGLGGLPGPVHFRMTVRSLQVIGASHQPAVMPATSRQFTQLLGVDRHRLRGRPVRVPVGDLQGWEVRGASQGDQVLGGATGVRRMALSRNSSALSCSPYLRSSATIRTSWYCISYLHLPSR